MFYATDDRLIHTCSIVFVITICLLLAIQLSWGVPITDFGGNGKKEFIPLPPTLENLSDYLRKGRYREVVDGSKQLLMSDLKAPVYGLLGVAFAGLEKFNSASEAMKRAKVAGEPDYQLLAHIGQGIIYLVREEYESAIAESRKAIKLDSSHPLAHATLGLAYFRKREYQKAAEYLKEAISVEPEYAHAHTALAANYVIQKKLKEAFTEYQRATEIDPLDPRPHMGLGTIYAGMGVYYSAIKEYETVLSLKSSDLQTRVQLAALYLQVNRYDDAITQAKAVLQANEQVAYAHLLLGRAYAFKNRFDAAIEHLRQLVELQANSSEGYYLLGLCLMAEDDFKSAKQYIQQAKQINSEQSDRTIIQVDATIVVGIINHVEEDFQQALANFENGLGMGQGHNIDAFVHFLMANLYLSQKELTKAKIHLGQAEKFVLRFQADNLKLEQHFDEASPKSSTHTNLAVLYLSKGWLDKALEECNMALQYHESNPLALYLKGQTLKQKQEFDQAIAQFQHLTKVAPLFISAHYELAEIYFATESLKKAISEYRKVIKLNPEDASMHQALGAVYEKAGKAKEAVKEYQQVIRLEPNAAIGYNQLAYCHAEEGRDLDEALTFALKAVELSPDNGAIIDTLGWVYFKKGDYERAVEKLKLATQAIPNSPSVRYHLGMAYIKSGDSQNALNEFRNALKISEKFEETDHTKAMIKEIGER